MKPAADLQRMVNTLQRQGMTIRDIAQASHLSHSTVHRIAIGDGREPYYSTYVQIEKVATRRLPKDDGR